MFRPLCTLPLPASLFGRFQELGFIYCEDVCHRSNAERVLDVKVEEILRHWNKSPLEYWRQLFIAPPTASAFKLLQEECDLAYVETFSRILDEYLDGGVSLQRITEFTGTPGSGKTQMCLQLCVDVQIPRAFHGLEGKAIYIDTSNGFTLSRLSEVAEACVSHCAEIAHTNNDESMLQAMNNFSKDTILKNVFYLKCLSYIDLVACIIHLKTFLQQNIQVKLIVIDNITFPLQSDSNYQQRVGLLYELIQSLQDIANVSKVAIVITNNLTTRIDSKGESSLVPALGESFGHCIHYRFILGCVSKNEFVCVSAKNVTKPPTTIQFQITKSGIRDVHSN